MSFQNLIQCGDHKVSLNYVQTVCYPPIWPDYLPESASTADNIKRGLHSICSCVLSNGEKAKNCCPAQGATIVNERLQERLAVRE